MTLHALDIPEDLAELATWLERHLVSLELAELVAELAALHPVPLEPAPSVRELLGPRLDTVLKGGLTTVPPEVLKRLLVQPTLLLELQELVLAQGGDYWDRVKPLSADMENRVERGRQRLELLFKAPESKEAQGAFTVARTPSISWYRQPWFASLATAATILLAVVVYQRYRNSTGASVTASQTAWGWNRRDATRQDLSANAYLSLLADAAGDWFNERPQHPLALARRISEFRQGCTVLILSEHKPLSDADRRWLSVRCRLWASKLDKHLAVLEAGRDPLQVRTEVDQTIRELVRAIQTHTLEATSGSRLNLLKMALLR